VRRFAALIPADGRVLDLACGSGRHARYLAELGYRVCAVDRDAEAVAGLTALARVSVKVADLEGGAWPYAGERFEGIVVVNYLHRPLLGCLLDALAPGGTLIYETFAAGNECYGRPRNPAFLLRPGELLDLVRGQLRVIAYEDLTVSEPQPACIQRICAVCPSGGARGVS
jgi:SAM-dependent methyltransferase